MKGYFMMLCTSAALIVGSNAMAGEPSPLAGRWHIVDRQCSGGYVPRDRFDLERDWASMSFFADRYDGHSEINGCNYWVAGRFEVNGRVLRVFDLRGASDCTSQPPMRQMSQLFEVTDDHLKLFSAPFQTNGACRAGDILEVTYRRY